MNVFFKLGFSLFSLFCSSFCFGQFYEDSDYDSNTPNSNYYLHGRSRGSTYHEPEAWSDAQTDHYGISSPSKPAPQTFDWDYHQTWRDDRQAYYSGKTQPQAYRDSHPMGARGIGYDADPSYPYMISAYEKQKEKESSFVAENNRLQNRDPDEPQEYYSRGGGGSSQKGRASREARQKMNESRSYYYC